MNRFGKMKIGDIPKKTFSLTVDVKPFHGFLAIIDRIKVSVACSDPIEPSCFSVFRSFFNPLPQNFDDLDSFSAQKDRPGDLLTPVARISNDINAFFKSLLQFPNSPLSRFLKVQRPYSFE